MKPALLGPKLSKPEAILIGELNPYGSDPYFALYPLPRHSAGGRLCTLVLGLMRGQYLDRFHRVNLCTGKWSLPKARESASAIAESYYDIPVVLLGSKVCQAFGLPFEPFTCRAHLTNCSVILPHPSGRNPIWNDPDSVPRARQALRQAGIHVG